VPGVPPPPLLLLPVGNSPTLRRPIGKPMRPSSVTSHRPSIMRFAPSSATSSAKPPGVGAGACARQTSGAASITAHAISPKEALRFVKVTSHARYCADLRMNRRGQTRCYVEGRRLGGERRSAGVVGRMGWRRSGPLAVHEEAVVIRGHGRIVPEGH